MTVVWSDMALDDLAEISAWIERERPSTARSVTLRILESVESLSVHGQLGRPGRVAGTRALAPPGVARSPPDAARNLTAIRRSGA